MNKENWVRNLLSFVGVILTLCIMLGGVSASAEEKYVIDNANLFTQAELQQLTEKASSLEEATTSKVMIFVDKSFRGEDSVAFAKKKYEQYRLPDNGIMIVLATEDRQIAVHTEMVDSTLDSVMPLLRANKMSEGVIALQDKFIQYFQGGVQQITQMNVQDQNTAILPAPENEQREATSAVVEKVVHQEKPTSMALYGLCFVLFIAFVLFCVLSYCQKKNMTEALEAELEKNASWQSKMKEQEQEHSDEIQEWCKSAEARTSEIHRLNQNLSMARSKIQKYESDFEVITILHPNIASEIEEYYRKKQEKADREKARQYDGYYATVMQESVSRGMLGKLRDALRQYEKLTSGERKWVTADLNALKHNLQVAEKLQQEYEEEQERRRCQKLARDFANSVENLKQSAQRLTLENRYRNVEALKREYQGLPTQAQNMLDVAFIQLWNQLYNNILHDCIFLLYPHHYT